MEVIIENNWLLATHTSISGFIITILIVFGSVILTLLYIGWKKYDGDEDGNKNIDQHDPSE